MMYFDIDHNYTIKIADRSDCNDDHDNYTIKIADRSDCNDDHVQDISLGFDLEVISCATYMTYSLNLLD